MRLVLDTDVVVSAMRSAIGASAEVLLRVRAGRAAMLATVPLFVEYEEVVHRPEHLLGANVSPEEADKYLDVLAALIEPVETYFMWRPQLRDADDEMVLEAAVNGGAQAIVTFNVRDFLAAAKTFGIEVLTPREALRRI
jgi:putative PIN family toxin of toxin-antitoxin system